MFNVTVNGVAKKVEFRVGELPNDMKFLYFLAGELSNNAAYFSTFADVNNEDLHSKVKKFGLDADSDWKPWCYHKRLNDAKLAAAKKALEAERDVTEETRRNNFTQYMGMNHSRQEEAPLIGRFIGCAEFEPLQGKNNTVKEIFENVAVGCYQL